MAVGVFGPYSEIEAMVTAGAAWVPVDQQPRISSYSIYEQVYWNHLETFKLVLRGDEERPLYIPNGRTIVEAAHRFVGKGLNVLADPTLGTPNDQLNMNLAFDSLFKRERFFSKYNTAKRYGLIRGDWLFHIRADPLKLPGTRISIHVIDPASYFTVPDPGNEDRIWKIHIAEPLTRDDGKSVVRKQTYTKMENGQIQTELADYEPDKWTALDAAPITTIVKPTLLDARITAFPVYHIPNGDMPGYEFGSSEIRGMLRLMEGVNQGVTDEDIALAMDGLGLYATDSGGPVDENGEDSDWVIGPGRVVENAANFKRVNGVGSVTPYGDHIDRLTRSMREATGTSEVAIGNVEVTVAESGVALALRMAPMLAKAEEKDLIIKEVIGHLTYDLATMWFPVYEAQSFGDAVPVIAFGEKLPLNRDVEVKLILEMATSPVPIISAATARVHLAKYGFEFDKNEEALIMAELAEVAAAHLGSGGAPDPVAARADAELAAP